jgi:hypothetical protein
VHSQSGAVDLSEMFRSLPVAVLTPVSSFEEPPS